jgi:hypothetical protein
MVTVISINYLIIMSIAFKLTVITLITLGAFIFIKTSKLIRMAVVSIEINAFNAFTVIFKIIIQIPPP